MSDSTSLNLFHVSDGIGLYIGRDIQTKLHVHHALEIVVAIGAPFILQILDRQPVEKTFSIIAPDVPHLFLGADDVYVFFYLDPEHRLARQLTDQLLLAQHEIIGDESSLRTAFAEQLRRHVVEVFATSHFAPEALYQLLSGLALQPRNVVKRDARIVQATGFIWASLHHEISLDKIAGQVFLSPSRFAHLFRKQTGIPFRRYVLWCRMQAALKAFMKAQSFTEAAYEAGFADVAHLSRTFTEMFGVSPSSVLKK